MHLQNFDIKRHSQKFQSTKGNTYFTRLCFSVLWAQTLCCGFTGIPENFEATLCVGSAGFLLKSIGRRNQEMKKKKYNHPRPLNYQNIKSLFLNLRVQTKGLSAPKKTLLKHLCYNSWLHSFLRHAHAFPKMLRILAHHHTTSLCDRMYPLCSSLRVCCVSWMGMFKVN